MHPFLTIADRAARSAGQIIMRALERLDRLQVHTKQPHDFVTEVDRDVEQLLIDHIRKAYPHHAILSEERGALANRDEHTWIIDPLDGTTNFIHGLPGFAISIALQYKNRLEQALIYDPLRQETFYASRGQGARLHQQRLRVSQRPQLKDALLCIGHLPRDAKHLERYLQAVHPLVAESAGIRHLGSAALSLAYVAAGRLDGFWSIGLKSWDIAAGALLVQEAGGIVCDATGGENYLNTGTVVGANPKLCRYLVPIAQQVASIP